jgi:putative Mg2+ transporter-C (MgtC) family protein
MDIAFEDIIRLLLAILVGGLIGAEREYRDKAAGFRTMIFICVGSTLFTMLSLKIARPTSDPARIAAQIVSGVGFLGAGAILRDTGGRVMGLTTAATIWLAAALGMGIGSGEYEVTLAGAGLILVVLWLFPFVEGWIDNRRHTETYEIVCTFAPDRDKELAALFRECDLRVHTCKRGKTEGNLITTWEVRGSPADHHGLIEKLLAHPDVKEFRVS